MKNDAPPSVYVIAGPNGSGKTTFASKFLPKYAHCYEFVNADLIASGLSPFSPETAAIQAGRLVLDRIQKLACQKKDFAFETTLYGRTYVPLLRSLKQQGFQIHLFYLWPRNINLALERIAERVRQGGHNVPPNVVERRFKKGLRNFFHVYKPILDSWMIFDNSYKIPQLIAEETSHCLNIINENVFNEISKYAGVL